MYDGTLKVIRPLLGVLLNGRRRLNVHSCCHGPPRGRCAVPRTPVAVRTTCALISKTNRIHCTRADEHASLGSRGGSRKGRARSGSSSFLWTVRSNHQLRTARAHPARLVDAVALDRRTRRCRCWCRCRGPRMRRLQRTYVRPHAVPARFPPGMASLRM